MPEDKAVLTALSTEEWDEAPVGSFCGPEAYDHQYRRYCQHLVVEEACNPLGSAARGPAMVRNDPHCCQKHEKQAGYSSYCCTKHSPRLIDPLSECSPCEALLQDDFNPDFWNDGLVLQNILDALREQQRREPARITTENPPVEPEDILKAVHGGTMLHHGLRRTWLLLNKLFPGHRIPMKKVQEFLDECPTCQKCRHKMRDNLKPFSRVLKPPHARHTIGCDTLSITPTSGDGFVGLVTIVNHFTHFVYLYPIKNHSAKELANALMSYIGNFGLVDEIMSDQGSDLMSAAIAELNLWLGLKHKVALVDVHTSNGCENSNRQIQQHLKTIVQDLRIVDQWADPMVLALVQYHFNSSVCKETQYKPFSMMMGSADDLYYQLKPGIDQASAATDFVKLLDKNLKTIRDISAQFQADLVEDRVKEAEKRNQYSVGDLVLKTVKTPTMPRKPTKLGVDFTGPWEVLKVNSNDYTCVHVTERNEKVFHVDMLKPYYGTMAMAERAALLDKDMHVVVAVSAYCGDPWAPLGCEFLLHYEDGSDLWLKYKDDTSLKYCQAFKDYCASVPELWPLQYTQKEAKKRRSDVNKQPILGYEAGDILYVDIRCFGPHWYNASGDGSLSKPLPEEDTTTYVCKCVVHEVISKGRKGLLVIFPVLKVYQLWTHENVLSWGQYRELMPEHVLVDRQLLDANPQVEASFTQSKVKEYLKLLEGARNVPKRVRGGRAVKAVER